MSELIAPIDIYCERTAHGLWAEPINLLTNISFFIAAYLLLRSYRAQQLKDPWILFFIILIAVIGLGSSLFHSFANRWSMLADIIPIMSFAIIYLWFALRRLLVLSWKHSAIFMLVFIYCGVKAGDLPAEYSLNGSMAYFPCWAAIALVALCLAIRKDPAAKYLGLAAFTFAASLTLRSLDMALCDSIPFGVHYFWHIFNGAVLYLLVRPLIGFSKKTNG